MFLSCSSETHNKHNYCNHYIVLTKRKVYIGEDIRECMTRKEEFGKEMKKLIVLEEAARGIYDTDVEKRNNARRGFRAVAKEITDYETTSQDYDDSERFSAISNPIRKAIAEKVAGYLGDNLEGILGEIEDSKLAELALAATSPVELSGNENHNVAVKAHEKWIKYQGMLQRGAKSYEEVRGEVVRLISEDLRERLSVDNDPKNKYVKDETKEQIINVISSLASSKELGLIMLNSKAREAEEKFRGIYKDEKSQAEYARANITALASKGDKERLAAAQSIYMIDS